MAYVRCFSGIEDTVRDCPQAHYWTIYPVVQTRSKEGTVTIADKSFEVRVDNQVETVKAGTKDHSITLVFNDTNDYAATVKHVASEFEGTVNRAQARSNISTVVLSKTWALDVIVKEKWSADRTVAFARAKTDINTVTASADDQGKRELRGLAAAQTIKLTIQGLDKKKCQAKIKTVLPSSADGFLKTVDDAEETNDGTDEVKIEKLQPGAIITVTFVVDVSAIKPKLTADPLALFFRDVKDHVTTLSEIVTELDTKHPSDDLAELKAALTFNDKISCFEEKTRTTAYTSATAVAMAKLAKLYVTGLAGGECKQKVVLSTARASEDRSWRIKSDASWPEGVAGDAEGAMWVEKLELGAYKFMEGKSIIDGSYKTALMTTTPKEREIHHQDSIVSFPVARLTVKKPSTDFFKHATVKLSPTPSGIVYKEKACTNILTELKASDFTADPLEVWVKAERAASLDAEPSPKITWSAWKALMPEKVVLETIVALGAKAGKKELAEGDFVRLNAYSLDIRLDRLTRNECGKRVKPEPSNEKVVYSDVALACAVGHRYYDMLSPFHVNKNYYRNAIYSFFNGFIRSMENPKGNNDSWSVDGAKFVTDSLAEHGIVLHAATQNLIKAYVKSVLDQRISNDYGFEKKYGVPGAHAEILAVNEILTQGVDLTEVTVATYKLQNTSLQGKRFIACPNCSGILTGGAKRPRIITG